MTHPPRADWQLPPGVSRSLWDYLHDPEIARNYDATLADSSLFTVDQQFCQHWFDRPGKLIDLGCGTGRLLIDFARKGCAVLGVDLSAEMLRVAGHRAVAEGVPVHRIQANLVQLDCVREAQFDYAACLFSTLGMIQGAQARQQVIRNAHRVLKPGGRLVLHVHNRWFNFWNRAGRRWLLGDLLRSICRHPLAGDRAMPVHQGIAGLSLHLFTRRETLLLLSSQRFRILDVQPVSLRPDGTLRWPFWFGWLRAYGYLIVAEKVSGS